MSEQGAVFTMVVTGDGMDRLNRQADRRGCSVEALLDGYLDWCLGVDEHCDDPNHGAV